MYCPEDIEEYLGKGKVVRPITAPSASGFSRLSRYELPEHFTEYEDISIKSDTSLTSQILDGLERIMIKMERHERILAMIEEKLSGDDTGEILPTRSSDSGRASSSGIGLAQTRGSILLTDKLDE